MHGADVRLYQEVLAGLTARGNQGQGTGAKRKEPKPSRFEQVASAAEEFQAIGEQLSRSRVKADKQLSSKVLSLATAFVGNTAISDSLSMNDMGPGDIHVPHQCISLRVL